MDMDMTCPRCWGSKKEPPTFFDRCGYCHGAGVSLDRYLSPHFKLSELLYSQTAVRHGIPNDPTDTHIGRLSTLCNELLEPVRTEFGPLHVDSGLRLPALNKAISGSSTTSAHSIGWAADFVPITNGISLKAVVDWIISSSKLKYDQVIYEGTWVHVGRFNAQNVVRHQALMAFPSFGRMNYEPYLASDPRVI